MQRTRLDALAITLAITLAATTSGAAAQPAPEGVRAPDRPPAPVPAPAKTAPAPAKAPPATPDPAQTKAKPAIKRKAEKAVYKGPTEADVRVAYTDRIDSINAGTAGNLDPATAAKLTIRLVKVDIVECAPVEERQDLYLCSVLVEASVGATAPEFKRIEIAMAKEKDAWRVQ